jgi:hypothetical protein
MATIARTTKAGSGTGDFAAATTIVASEANADLNTIYNEFNGSIAAANLASNAVTTAKILDANVTTAKIAVGATYPEVDSATPGTGLSITTGETTVVTFPSITTRGGRVCIFGTIAWSVATNQSTQQVTIRIKRDAVTIRTYVYDVASGNVADTNTYPLPTPFFEEALAAGSYVYIITVQTSNASVGVSTPASNSGLMIVRELA